MKNVNAERGKLFNKYNFNIEQIFFPYKIVLALADLTN